MPLYDVKCFRCGTVDSIFRKMDERDENLPHCPKCLTQFTRIISPARILADIIPYESPKSGKWISSRSAMREDLKATNSQILEPGMKEDIARNAMHAREKAFAPVAEAVDNTVSALVSAGKLET